MIDSLYKVYLQCPIVTTDSRNCPKGSLFFALKGERFDGNKYAANALENGASYAVVDDPMVAKENSERYIFVTDTLQALQDLAAYHRAQFKAWEHPVKVIGITGTNGKTTTKELLYTVLAEKYHVLATEGNLNNQIGVPLTLLKIRPDHDIAIVEMGANHPMDIADLCAIVKPDYGLITNVGKAHLFGFGSFEGVIEAKTKLYESLRTTGGTAFVDAGNEHLCAKLQGLTSVSYGIEGIGPIEGMAEPNVTGQLLDCSPFLHFNLKNKETGEVWDVATHLIGDYNLINAVAASAVASYFGVPMQQIQHALQSYMPSNMRSQLVDIKCDTKIILDAYNANPSSMLAALKSYALNTSPRRNLILGDMRELGEESQNEHHKVLDYLAHSTFNDVLLVGPEFEKVFDSLDDAEAVQLAQGRNVRVYASTENLCADTETLCRLSGVILIKGSRGIALEKVVAKMKELFADE